MPRARFFSSAILLLGLFLFAALPGSYASQEGLVSATGTVVDIDSREVEISESESTIFNDDYSLNPGTVVTYGKSLPQDFEARIADIDDVSSVVRRGYIVELLIDPGTSEVVQIIIKGLPR